MTGTTSGDDKLTEIRKRHDSAEAGLFVRDMQSYRGCDAQTRRDHFNTTYEVRKLAARSFSKVLLLLISPSVWFLGEGKR